jgi:hypothetical protein
MSSAAISGQTNKYAVSLDGVAWTVNDEAWPYCGFIADAKLTESVLITDLKVGPELFSSGRPLLC